MSILPILLLIVSQPASRLIAVAPLDLQMPSMEATLSQSSSPPKVQTTS